MSKSRIIVKTVQRYGIMHIPSAKLVEIGFNTMLDAQYSCAIHQRVANNPDDFSVVETSVARLEGTLKQIEGWLGRGIEDATSPPLKENLRPKCPVFKFTQWGYQKGPDGITHEDVWFHESVLKGKGLNLLKRLSGTKSKPVKKSVDELYAEFVYTNPFVGVRQQMMFVRRSAGLSRKQAYQYLKNKLVCRDTRL